MVSEIVVSVTSVRSPRGWGNLRGEHAVQKPERGSCSILKFTGLRSSEYSSQLSREGGILHR